MLTHKTKTNLRKITKITIATAFCYSMYKMAETVAKNISNKDELLKEIQTDYQELSEENTFLLSVIDEKDNVISDFTKKFEKKHNRKINRKNRKQNK